MGPRRNRREAAGAHRPKTMFYEQKMTSLEAPEFWRFWRVYEKAKKKLEEDRKRPGKGQKRPGKRPEEARNPEFGEKLLETQCFMNRK